MVALARNISARRSRVGWYRCLKLDMHILLKYVCIDAPGVLGALYMYVCMHVCMYYACMYVCTLFGALFGAPISIRRDDRRAGWHRCVLSWIYMYYECMYISTRREYWEYYICMHVCMYACIVFVCMYVCMYVFMYVCMYAIRRDICRADCYSARRSAHWVIWMCLKLNILWRYVYIMKVCIYRRAGITGSTIYVCMHACICNGHGDQKITQRTHNNI